MSLQDWAVSKSKSGRNDDALLHLQETETTLYSIKADENQVTQMLLDGVKRKNTRLIEEVKDAKENNIEKRRLEIQAQKEKDDDIKKKKKIAILAGGFALGFTFTYWVIGRGD